MPKESERKVWLNGEWVTEHQIPTVFDLSFLFHDYKIAVETLGQDVADKKFETLLDQQLRTLVQEIVFQPLTPNFFYKLVKQDDGNIQVIDEAYPQNPDIVKRANPEEWYKPSAALHRETPFAKLFLDRFTLEYEQIKSLVNDHIAKDPLLALVTIDQLAQYTSPIQVQLEGGKTVEGYVSNWYANGMPATKVHKGGGSYFNIYRIVAVPKEDDTVEHFIQKQGYYHKLKWKTQAEQLMNIDQVEKYIPQNEQEFMMRTILLNQRRNYENPEDTLIEIGLEVGDKKLPKRIKKARQRQLEQEEAIRNSISGILSIFKLELDKPQTEAQKQRFKAGFEAFISALYFKKHVPNEKVVESYENVLQKGLGRDAFVASLLNSMPSLMWEVQTWAGCGLATFGGVVQNGLDGLGGLNFKLEKGQHICPHCCGVSSSLDKCSSCGFVNPRLSQNEKKIGSASNSPAKQQFGNYTVFHFLPSLKAFNNHGDAGIGRLLERQTDSVSGHRFFEFN